MDLTQIIARLRAAASGLRVIGGAADFDTAMGGALVTPSLFVIPLAEQAVELEQTGETCQAFLHQFAVLQCVANVRDARGEAALNGLVAVRMQVRKALVGFVIDPENGESVIATGGRLLRLDGDGRLWWADEFRIKSYYRSTP